MATIADPNFWKRFSAAIHMDEEEKAGGMDDSKSDSKSESSDSSNSSRPKMEHSASWLVREKAKKRRRNYMCWGFWVGFLGFIAGLVVLIVWLDNAGIFHKINQFGAHHDEAGS